ncbi:MAG TPA: galactokinase family protein [Solirubrobacteraceae bacterium]|nr:galactokinase family protein [Solirubrobacteraceae bacterium]
MEGPPARVPARASGPKENDTHTATDAGTEDPKPEEPRARTYAHASTPKKNSPTPPDRVWAKAPGRVCLIGEHTDYNEGLALAFAIAESVTVEARRLQPGPEGEELVQALASDFGEEDEFVLADPPAAKGWRAFVRGMVAELAQAGLKPVGASLRIEGGVPRGAGLSSSAALEVALALALLALAGLENEIGKTDLARLCSKVENEWAGARTGLLDQLASLYGEPEHALLIDFEAIGVEPVPLRLKGWRVVVYDTGERRENASSGYNQRRAECAEACRLLGVSSLREASPEQVGRLPEPLRGRAVHVLGDNERVERAVGALRAEDMPALAELLNESHRSLRDRMAISTPTVDAAVARMREAGAAGARIMGGGFGGSVLALLPPGVAVPPGAREVRPCGGAQIMRAKR